MTRAASGSIRAIGRNARALIACRCALRFFI